MLSGPPVSGALGAEQLLEQFLSGSARQRRGLLARLEQRRDEILPLVAGRLERLDPTGDDWAPGWLIQLLLASGQGDPFLDRHPAGWLAVTSAAGQDYRALQRHLMQQEFELADRLTSDHLRALAGPSAERRGYVYYSEVAAMPAADLESLDRLWICYSRGRFGFSVQGRLLRACGGQWERLWPRIGWKENGVWTRYPGSFTWSLDAPDGHMPLINQLRGVRLMDALLRHPAIAERIEPPAAGAAG
ncbi:MAG: GUN4 domain-containing protein [Synechococcaceae cyanobacterium]|nr:GUN4 domain-containing protein [Synechococcaceae cyanobacterium]